MARKNKPDIAMNPECNAALARVTKLADRLAAGLVGEELPACGRPETAAASVLSSGMIYFLLRIDPADLHALFSDEGSLKRFAYKRQSRKIRIPPLLAEFW